MASWRLRESRESGESGWAGLKNHGKTMGKPLENGDLSIFKPQRRGISIGFMADID